MSDNSRVAVNPLRNVVTRIFTAAGLSEEGAATTADHLVQAELRGVSSHGVSRTAVYVERVRSGLVDPRPTMRTEAETPVSARLDGGNGPGIVVARAAMETAIDKAKASGMGAVAVHRSNHCGMLAYYTSAAADRGLIALATTSAPPTMAPWGAAAPFFGTNPLSYAVPVAGERPNIVFDMATSTVARGKIILADKKGEPIPIGWALDASGSPTQDPAAGVQGTMLPLGGAKGSGLALLVDILSGVLSGANYGPHIPPLYDNPHTEQDVGHFFLAMNPDLFTAPGEFADRMAGVAEEVTALRPATDHSRVYLPGEPEAVRAAENLEAGLDLAPEVRAEIAATADALDVSIPDLAYLV
ncbi:Ldh family oxidoreductase [Spiractinospora alimapuensis]|uniref:Ldh family oxidoreductase n=1 Tax=Spiractinospora alimapuensis TaxID=2820884 RepID=UPI001F25D5EC|nr:Ldh family oxidoreductase [Spiractinospora alimapuensis]QVQ52646.1 Ldh family oxidoreductase [Spiractinospora alimapuensis]